MSGMKTQVLLLDLLRYNVEEHDRNKGKQEPSHYFVVFMCLNWADKSVGQRSLKLWTTSSDKPVQTGNLTLFLL